MKRISFDDSYGQTNVQTKKKKVHVVDVRSRQKKPLYGTPNAKAPFYDPHSLHIHIWTRGTLQTSLEKHASPYYAHDRENKEYSGTYCKVCHEIKIRFNQNLVDTLSGYSDSTMNLQDLGLCYDDETAKKVDRVEKRWKVILSKLLHRKVWGTRYPSDPTTEDLILDNVCCDFYYDGVVRKGIIICQLPNKDALIVENFTGHKYQVNSHFVFSIYDKYTTKSSLYAIGDIPKTVLVPLRVTEWKEKWNNYKKWELVQERLKFFLPEQCQYYQTFYDDEVPEPVYSGPDTHDIYVSKQIQYNMQLMREHKKTQSRTSEFDKLGAMKYKIYTFFIPPDGVYENYVVVEKEDDQVRTYPTLQLYSRKLMELEQKMSTLRVDGGTLRVDATSGGTLRVDATSGGTLRVDGGTLRVD